MVQLGATAGHLVLGTTVGDDGVLGAQALGGTDGVHSHVAATKDDDVLAVLGGVSYSGNLLAFIRFTRVRYSLAKKTLGRFSPGTLRNLGRPAPVAT